MTKRNIMINPNNPYTYESSHMKPDFDIYHVNKHDKTFRIIFVRFL